MTQFLRISAERGLYENRCEIFPDNSLEQNCHHPGQRKKLGRCSSAFWSNTFFSIFDHESKSDHGLIRNCQVKTSQIQRILVKCELI